MKISSAKQTLALHFFLLFVYYKFVVPFFFPELAYSDDGSLEIKALSTLKIGQLRRISEARFEDSLGLKRAIIVPIWSDNYILPALVLFRSLTSYGTKVELGVLVPNTSTSFGVTKEKLKAFKAFNAKIKYYEQDFPKDWSSQFFKLYAWKLVEYDEILLLDSDTLAVSNIDDIFEKCKAYSHTLNGKICGFKNPSVRPSSLVEAEMWHAGNYINAGVLILKPSLAIFYDMMEKVGISGMCCKFAFEQDFLNWYFTTAQAKSLIALPLQFYYNNNPATHLIHYCHGGKPWYWWAYPIPVIGTPLGSGWAATSSAQWAYFRASLPHGLCYGFLTPLFLSLAAYPIAVLLSIMAYIYVKRSEFFERSREKGALSVSMNVPYGIVSIFVLWVLFFSSVGREGDLGLIPGRLSPHLAWTLVTLTISSTLTLVFFTSGDPSFRWNETWNYFVGIQLFALSFLCLVVPLRFFNIVTVKSRNLVWLVFGLSLCVLTKLLSRIVTCSK